MVAVRRQQPEPAMQTQVLTTSLNETETTRTFRVRDAQGKLLYATRSLLHAENIERAWQRLVAYATDEQVHLVNAQGKVKIAPLDPTKSTKAERATWGRKPR